MKSKHASYEMLVSTAAAFFFGMGVVFHLVPATSALVRPLAPYMLLVFGALAMYPVLTVAGRRGLLWATASYVAGFSLEAAGVATGLIFGPYEYGTALGSHVLRVPPIIGFNWVVVVAGCLALASLLLDVLCLRRGARRGPEASGTTKKPATAVRAVSVAVLAGFLAVAFDWVMEPVAVALGYWTWLAPAIPLRNYLAWFLFAFASSLGWMLWVDPQTVSVDNGAAPLKKYAAPVVVSFLAVQLAFFALLRIAVALGCLPQAVIEL